MDCVRPTLVLSGGTPHFFSRRRPSDPLHADKNRRTDQLFSVSVQGDHQSRIAVYAHKFCKCHRVSARRDPHVAQRADTLVDHLSTREFHAILSGNLADHGHLASVGSPVSRKGILRDFPRRPAGYWHSSQSPLAISDVSIFATERNRQFRSRGCKQRGVDQV